MPTEPLAGKKERHNWFIWIEGGLLLAITPFLLFPTFWLVGTMVALLALVAVWLWPLLAWRRPGLPVTSLNIPLSLWGLMLIVGVLVTADPDLTLPKITGLILGLAYWRLIIHLGQHRWGLAASLLGFGLLAAGFTGLGSLNTNWIVKVPGLAQAVALLPSALMTLPESGDAGVHANQLAGTILIYWPLLLSLAVGWRPPRWARVTRLGLAAGGLLVMGLLVITQSRSGWLGGLGGVAVLFFLWAGVLLPRQKWWVLWLCLAVLAGGTIVAVGQLGPENIMTLWESPPEATVIGRLQSIGFRQEVWQWAVAGVRSFPFTGTGLGSFRRVVQRLYPIQVAPTYDISHAHNIFLQVALDVGLPGLVAYVALLLLAGEMGWQAAKRSPELRPFALGLLAGLAALHIYGLTDALAPGSKTTLLFWVMLGILTAMKKVSSE